MALLKIQEPKEVIPQKRLAVGIDLGTTHSLVACDVAGSIQILKDEAGQTLLPSVVRYLANGDKEIGQVAKDAYVQDPQNTFLSMKRLMGTGAITPVEVSAHILRHLMARAQQMDNSITEAVITVPAYFDDAQRQATKDAARIAGIEVLRLLNEPTAAAIAYGLDQGAKGYCLVFDLGGGTFDVSILSLNQGVFEVLATGGDTVLGGDDIDTLIVKWVLEQAPSLSDYRAQLLMQARSAKEALSRQEQTVMRVQNWQITLTRACLNELIQPIVARTLAICQRVLNDAKLNKATLDHIVLVGGSTRIPLIQQAVAEFFGKPPRCDLNPDEVVTMGAAIQASQLVGNRSQDNVLLLDVIPLSLGIEVMGGVVEKILSRNTPIPAQETQTFTTYADGQTGLSLHVVQGERELVKDCRSLAQFDLNGIPPMAQGKARIEITFQVDADGLLSVSAKELSTGVHSEISVKPTYGLTEQEVIARIEDSIQHAQDDARAKKLLEKIQEAEQLLAWADNALTTDPHLLAQAECLLLNEKMFALRQAMAAADLKALKLAFQACETPIQDFAQKRLTASLHGALAGKSIDDLENILS